MLRSSPTRPTSVPSPRRERHAGRCSRGRPASAPIANATPVDVAVEHVDQPGVGAAQPDGLPQHRLEHRLELERRAPEHLEHLGRGRLALERLGEVALEPLDLLVRHTAGDFIEST